MKRPLYLLLIVGFTFTACEPQKDYVLCDDGKVEKNGECECPEGYVGDNCDVLLRDNLLGEYKGTLTWNDTGNYNNNVVRIDTIPLAKGQVAVSVYSNNFTRAYSCAIVDSNHFISKGKKGADVEGTMRNGILQLTEHLQHDGDLSKHNGTYKYIGEKQQ